MSYFGTTSLNPATSTLDAGTRVRISQITTLVDGKILNTDNTNVFDTQGTGTGLYGQNKYNMSVTAGQYLVRQTRRFAPYFAGKSQMCECTFDNFQSETGTTKRVGYFSTSATVPYSATTDGFWLENNGTTISIKASRSGTTTVDVPMSAWTNYNSVSTYDWSHFTVILFDFLWLGGAVLRLFLKTDQGFVLCHTVNYAGSATDVFILSPNQPIRYEIKSTTGTGSLRYICSQVATEGSTEEHGYNNSVQSLSTAAVASNTIAVIGTIYPLKAIRKLATHRDCAVKVTGVGVYCSSTNDIVYWTLQLNPTLSAPLTYTSLSGSCIEEANGSAVAAISTTVTASGRELCSGIIGTGQQIPTNLFEKDFLAFLGCSLNNTMDQIVLCIRPITTNVTVNGVINVKEY
jgi:hypothetical protein